MYFQQLNKNKIIKKNIRRKLSAMYQTLIQCWDLNKFMRNSEDCSYLNVISRQIQKTKQRPGNGFEK